MFLLYNKLWREGTFPAMWKIGTIIPFPKPGKDLSNPINYRPIALTSCTCKLMERMVNLRLVWNLEKNNIIHENQYGFRRCRSTTDVLVKIDSYIKRAFAMKEHVVAVFFDIQKAYDTTWKYKIIKELKTAGFIGSLTKFISNFLSNRQMKVKVGDQYSDSFTQFEGVPQGSVLSCTLFALAMNDLPANMPQYVETSLYVDDFAVFARSSSLASADRRVQLAVNRAKKWADESGFVFSSGKTLSLIHI